MASETTTEAGHGATDAAHGAADVAHGAAAHGEHYIGMPQLNFDWYPNQMFWLVVTLVVIYLVLFFIQAVTPNASLFTIAVIAICLYAVAYTADIIRGGIESVPRTQSEAAEAMKLKAEEARA